MPHTEPTQPRCPLLSPEEKLARFKKAVARKHQWNDTYREALSYAAPQRDSFRFSTPGATKNNPAVFDSTAQVALQKFVAALQGAVMPIGKRWITLIAGQGIPLDAHPNMNDALDSITDILFNALQLSNFHTQMAEALCDLAVGTGALLVLKGTDEQPLRFIAVPLSQLYLEEGAYGDISAAYRKHKLPVRVLSDTWPDAALPPSLQTLLDKEPDKEVELIESTLPCVYSQYDPLFDKDIEIHGYAYSVTYAPEGKDIVQRMQKSSPWVVFRWSTLAGEIYGRGPLLNALPDIKTLNKTKELMLKNASLAVAGAYTVADDGVVNVNNINIQPGALIPVASNGGGVNGPTLSPLPRSGDFDMGQLIVADLQRSINDALFADALGPVELPNKSATEMLLRDQELARRIGSAFGRLQYELMIPLIKRCLHVLEEMGHTDLARFQINGREISVVSQQ